MKKKIVVTCGPIPARVDSVKFLTNMFKGGLAFRTASWLARDPGFEVTVVCWKHTPVPKDIADWHALVTVCDVFEYYDWITANAKNYDAFVMAAAVANLTPVHPWEGKFPSHEYKPGEEFDIRFMIAPRAIDAIKPLNPRACVIGYKLFDADNDDELVDIARHTLADAKANVIFANHPKTAKDKKIAVTADGSAIPMTFDQHLEFMARAIRQEYFMTKAEPLTEKELADPDIREALMTVGMYEQTFDQYGTVAVPVANHGKMFATTPRGHKGGPVIVRDVDGAAGIVTASNKATLNAPALAVLLQRNNYEGIVVHRHFDDDMADKEIKARYEARFSDCRPDPSDYVFPGTFEEYGRARRATCDGTASWMQPYHGYLAFRPIEKVDWTRYEELFPERYFEPQAEMLNLIKYFREHNQDVLEIGGNRRPMGNLSYDPYCAPDPDFARAVGHDELVSGEFPLTVCFNAINYLSRAEIAEILAHSGSFAANTFRAAPLEKVSELEYAVRDDGHNEPVVRHGLWLNGDGLMRHRFHAYGKDDFEGMGLRCWEYGRNSMVVYRNLHTWMGLSKLTEAAEAAEKAYREGGM